MIEAPHTFAASKALRPTAPAPQVTKLLEGVTFKAFIHAPAPV